MINNEKQYHKSMSIVKDGEKTLALERTSLEKEGRTPEEIKRFLAPTRSFLQSIVADIEWYENAKNGIIPPMESLETIGQILVALRIAKGLTQEQLAEKMKVAQPQVSRDENEEYRGITLERAQKIMSVLDAKLQKSKVIIGHHSSKAA